MQENIIHIPLGNNMNNGLVYIQPIEYVILYATVTVSTARSMSARPS